MKLRVKGMLVLISAFLFLNVSAYAGELNGVIIKEDGNPLGDAELNVEDKGVTISIKTNTFGGYKIKLKDGEKELKFKIGDTVYISEKINVYSPAVKQNWKIDPRNRRLIKIR